MTNHYFSFNKQFFIISFGKIYNHCIYITVPPKIDLLQIFPRSQTKFPNNSNHSKCCTLSARG